MKRDVGTPGGGSISARRDFASRHFLRPGTHAAKLEVAMRILGDKHCLKRPVPRTQHTERVSLLDRWRAQRQA